jgi:hypothetical protein
MIDVLRDELKIDGAAFPAAWESNLRSRLARIQLGALIAGLAFLVCMGFAVIANRQQFFFSWLFACLFWMQLSLGCLLLTMIHFLTGGRWGFPTRRFMEAGFMTLPWFMILVIPIFFGLSYLYPWARVEDVAADSVLQGRHFVQNPLAFGVRTFLYLGLWTWLAWRLRVWSLRQDKTQEAEPTRRARVVAGPGIVIFSLLGTLAAVDWIMSLEKHWYSTMFAVVVIIGQILLALAFSVLMLAAFRKEAPLVSVVNKTHFQQLGNLLLAFVMFWTYVSFGELLIIYSGDLPHEVDWYLHRIASTWKILVAILAIFHFFVPFFILLFRAITRRPTPLAIVAAMLFLSHIVSVYWMVMPALHNTGLRISWLDFAAFLGVGGVWVAAFLSNLRSAPILPQHDPGLQFAFKYEP